MVFDQKGELRSACPLGEELGKVTKQGFDVPNAFVEIVEKAMKEPLSLEQAERDYVSSRGSKDSFDALRAKLKALDGVGQMHVSEFLAKAREHAEDPIRSLARGLQVEADACSHQVINHSAFKHLRDGLVDFVVAHPGHPAAGEMLSPLLDVGMKYSFDVLAKCRMYAKQWSRSGDEALERRADQLLKQASKKVASAAKELAGMEPDDYGHLRLESVCGNAQAVVTAMKTTKTYGVFRPIHAEWRSEAAAKVAGQSGR